MTNNGEDGEFIITEFVMFEKSGHNPYREEREKYLQLLNEYLAKEN